MQTAPRSQSASVVQGSLVVRVMHTEMPLVVCSHAAKGCGHPPDPARQLNGPGQVVKQSPERHTAPLEQAGPLPQGAPDPSVLPLLLLVLSLPPPPLPPPPPPPELLPLPLFWELFCVLRCLRLRCGVRRCTRSSGRSAALSSPSSAARRPTSGRATPRRSSLRRVPMDRVLVRLSK